MTDRRLAWLMAILAVVLAVAWTCPLWAGQPPAAEPTATKPPAPNQVTLWKMLMASGICGVGILLESIIAVALVVEHFLSIRRSRLIPPEMLRTVEQHLAAQRYDQAKQVCLRDGSFMGQVISAGLGQIGSMFGFYDMQTAMQEVSEREVGRLYRKLEYLSFIAATAPMLGLLGTVTGMISAFNEVAASEGAAKPAQLAGGIWEALMTTAEGLVVAIPIMFFVSFFRNRIDDYVAEAESVVDRLMGHFRKANAT